MGSRRASALVLAGGLVVLIVGGAITPSAPAATKAPPAHPVPVATHTTASTTHKAAPAPKPSSTSKPSATADPYGPKAQAAATAWARSVIVTAFGKPSSNNGELESIRSLSVSPYIDPRSGASTGWTIDTGPEAALGSVTSVEVSSQTLLQAIYTAHAGVQSVNVDWYSEAVNAYGQISVVKVAGVRMTGATAAKIDWANFLFKNLPLVLATSPDYWSAPAPPLSPK